jgi:hypothetical protein
MTATPTKTTAEKQESLKNNLKNRTNQAVTTEIAWKLAGFEIPVVQTMDEVRKLADEGLPSSIKNPQTGFLDFGPELVWDEYVASLKELRDEFETSLKEAEQDEERSKNRLKTVADMLKTPEIDWLVEDKIHRAGLFQIFGASYTGKTLLVLDLVMSWCAGLPEWQGYKLNNDGKPQDAVYVAAEGGAALSVHVDAWLKYHSDVDPSRLSGLVFLDGGEGHHMFLGIGKEQPQFEDGWPRLVREIVEADIEPSLVVFDTQIDLAPGIDENSNTDMVGVLREVKRLGDSLGFMAIVVHHTGHDGNKARGASGMMGKCDAQAKLTSIGEKSGKARLEWTKVKGRAVPQDSISYHIQGYREIPGFDSEGAVCVPLDKMSAAIAAHNSKAPVAPEVQRKYMLAVQDEALSLNGLAKALGFDRNNKVFKDAVDWMLEAKLLEKNPGPKNGTYYSIHPTALIPAHPDADI